MITNYGFVCAATLSELTEKVKNLISQGCKPLGGVVFLGFTREYKNNGGFGISAVARSIEEIDQPFVQTMIQEKDEDLEKKNEII